MLVHFGTTEHGRAIPPNICVLLILNIELAIYACSAKIVLIIS